MQPATRIPTFQPIMWWDYALQLSNCETLEGHQQLSGKSEENKSFQPNQLAPSIYIMKALSTNER